MSQEYDVTTMVADMSEAFDALDGQELEDHERAFHFLKGLAAIGRDVPESIYKFYASGVVIPEEILYAVTSYFEGAGLLNIVCDCEGLDHYYCVKPKTDNNRSYENGATRLKNEDNEYIEILDQVEGLRNVYR